MRTQSLILYLLKVCTNTYLSGKPRAVRHFKRKEVFNVRKENCMRKTFFKQIT